MSKLILKRFQCDVETDEIGADSPYFLTAVADIVGGDVAVQITRQGSWHNEVDQGENWTVNHTVADGFNFVKTKTVVLCAMVEEDEGVDIVNDEKAIIKSVVKARLDALRQSGVNTVTPLVTADLLSKFKAAIMMTLLTGSGAGDDFVAAKALSLNNQSGEQPVVRLIGDGGKYAVRYGVA